MLKPNERSNAVRHNKAVARIVGLNRLLKDTFGWIDLVHAGFVRYFLGYRVWDSLFHDNWRDRCYNEALGDICDVIETEAKDIGEAATEIKTILAKSEGKIAELKDTVKYATTRLSRNQTMMDRVRELEEQYHAKGRQATSCAFVDQCLL